MPGHCTGIVHKQGHYTGITPALHPALHRHYTGITPGITPALHSGIVRGIVLALYWHCTGIVLALYFFSLHLTLEFIMMVPHGQVCDLLAAFVATKGLS